DKVVRASSHQSFAIFTESTATTQCSSLPKKPCRRVRCLAVRLVLIAVQPVNVSPPHGMRIIIARCTRTFDSVRWDIMICWTTLYYWSIFYRLPQSMDDGVAKF
ncbi:hypothetical protein F444_18184, partial [Phytophthora nicotianae P1976]